MISFKTSGVVSKIKEEQGPNRKQEGKKKCGERGSNTRPSDLQSDALPTELSPLHVIN